MKRPSEQAPVDYRADRNRWAALVALTTSRGSLRARPL